MFSTEITLETKECCDPPKQKKKVFPKKVGRAIRKQGEIVR